MRFVGLFSYIVFFVQLATRSKVQKANFNAHLCTKVGLIQLLQYIIQQIPTFYNHLFSFYTFFSFPKESDVSPDTKVGAGPSGRPPQIVLKWPFSATLRAENVLSARGAHCPQAENVRSARGACARRRNCSSN